MVQVASLTALLSLDAGSYINDTRKASDFWRQKTEQISADARRMAESLDREGKRAGDSMGNLRRGIAGVGLQLQDVAVQLQSGTNIFTVIAQQAPQAAGAFGGIGVAVGTVIAITAAAAGAFLGLGKNIDVAKEATDRMKASQEAFDSLLPKSIKNVDDLRKAYEKLTGAQKDALSVGLGNQGAELQTAIAAELKKVDEAFKATGGASRLSAIDQRLGVIGTFAGGANSELSAALARERTALEAERTRLQAAQKVLQDLLSNDATSSAQGKLQDFLSSGDKNLQEFARSANEASGRIADLAKQLKELQERQRELANPGTGDVEILGGRSSEAAAAIKKEERERIAAAKRVAAEEKRLARELAAEKQREYKATVQLLIGQANAGEFDDGRSLAARERGAKVIAELERDRKRAAEETERELKREADRQADILVRPFQDAAQAATNAFTSAFEQILTEGRVSAGELAKSFGDSITRTVAQLPALLAQIPISAGIESITKDIAEEMKNGGSGFAAFLNNPFGAGALGISAGMLGSSLYGGNSTGSSIGGLGGAVFGGLLGNYLLPGVGGAIGAGIGGLGGGLIGGLFGGGGGNNGAGSALRLGTGLLLPGSDAKSGQNQQQANAILQSLQQTQQLLLRAGVSFDDTRLRVRIGDKSGFQLFANDNERKFGSANQLQAGAFQELLKSGSGYSATLETVLATVKGKRAEVVQDALAFAAAFDKLASPAGELIGQLRELNIQFDQAASRAESYGLSVAEIEKARAKATKELLENAEQNLTSRVQQIKGAFEALLDPIRQTLTGINIGGLSALSPSAQLELARGQFQSLAGKALAGDEKSIQQISGAGQTFLQQARQFGASGEVFQAAFREVNQVLSQVLATGEARQENILASLPDAIRNANIDTIAALQKGFGEMVDQVAALRAEIARVRPLAA